MKTMRKIIFATVLGATITLSAQAATPRTENKTQYEQGRKNQEYKKDEWNKRGPAHYEAKKSTLNLAMDGNTKDEAIFDMIEPLEEVGTTNIHIHKNRMGNNASVNATVVNSRKREP
jgi:hypothetical protein